MAAALLQLVYSLKLRHLRMDIGTLKVFDKKKFLTLTTPTHTGVRQLRKTTRPGRAHFQL